MDKIVFAGFLAWLFLSPQQPIPAGGEWVLNVPKTSAANRTEESALHRHLGMSRLSLPKATISRTPDGRSVVLTTDFYTGAPSGFVFKADGTPEISTSGGWHSTYSMLTPRTRRYSAGQLVLEGDVAFEPGASADFQDWWAISADGMDLTLTRKITTPQGVREVTLVFSKATAYAAQPAAPSVAVVRVFCATDRNPRRSSPLTMAPSGTSTMPCYTAPST